MNTQDVERIGASPVWRQHRVETTDTSDGRVLVKGQQPLRTGIGYGLLNLLARLTGSRILQAIPLHGGARSQAVEVGRLKALYESGIRVPQVLHVAPDWFAMEFREGPNLAEVLTRKAQPALGLWEQGLQAIQNTHSCGQYLSQAQARNFIVSPQGLVAIDFEDDPLEVMTLAEAQAHDWLVYLLSTAWLLPGLQDGLTTQALAIWERFVPWSSTQAEQLLVAARRLGWLRHLPSRRKPWGRDIVSAQAAAFFLHHWAQQRHPG